MKIQVKMDNTEKYVEVLCVEDGSLNVEDLVSAGIPCDKILVYRKGAKPPYILRIRKEEDVE